MKTTIELLKQHPQVSGYKINIHRKESYELFFAGGKLETVRCTDTCDKIVTVYADHDTYRGDSQFLIYPSTTEEQIRGLIDETVKKALLISNRHYELPAKETDTSEVASNFRDHAPAELAAQIAGAVFAANTDQQASLNSVEIFINKHTETVLNSRGLDKTQIRWDAMVEAIPTYNGENESVELYEQYNFSSLDCEAITRQIAEKLAEAKARFEAVKPEGPISCDVILNRQELAELFWTLADDLNYATVYSHSNLFKKGDPIQKAPEGDRIGIVLAGEVPGNVRSMKFDSDGMSLGSIRIVDGGRAVNYYGSNRFGQYLGETPTGDLRCITVDAGTVQPEELEQGPYLEVLSMSGLQVDLFSDYIGGEIRLARWHDGSRVIPVTGISISGSLSKVLDHIRLSARTAVLNGYTGPAKAILSGMTIF